MFSESKFSRRAVVDWNRVPTKTELIEYYLNWRARALGVAPLTLQCQDYFVHKSSEIPVVQEMYVSRGFDTEVLLQDPFGHNCPTVACPIGFPSNLHIQHPDLRRYNRWICRLHAEIVHDDIDPNKLLSVPHVEVDPAFHGLGHLIDTYLSGHVLRGPVVVKILESFNVE